MKTKKEMFDRAVQMLIDAHEHLCDINEKPNIPFVASNIGAARIYLKMIGSHEKIK